jgi:hypothetical protein
MVGMVGTGMAKLVNQPKGVEQVMVREVEYKKQNISTLIELNANN